jgi:hypothetical protein
MGHLIHVKACGGRGGKVGAGRHGPATELTFSDLASLFRREALDTGTPLFARFLGCRWFSAPASNELIWVKAGPGRAA